MGWLLSCDDKKAYRFRTRQEGHETVESFERELTSETVQPGLWVDLQKLQ